MDLVLSVEGDPPGNQLVAAGAAGDCSLITSLLKQGVSVDSQQTHYGWTALHAAADAGHVRAVEYLIDSGAALDILDVISMTPLMHACSRGRSKVALLLMAAGADVQHERSDDQMTALKFALWGKCSRAVLKELLARGAKKSEAGFTVIHLKSDEPAVSPLLRLIFLGLLLVTIAVSVAFVLRHVEEFGL